MPGRPGPGKRGAKKPTKEDALKAAEAKQQRLAEATARDDKVRRHIMDAEMERSLCRVFNLRV
jgi:hypothetical protein